MTPARAAAARRIGALAAIGLVAFVLVLGLVGRSAQDVQDVVDGAGAWGPVLFVVLLAGLTCAFFPFPLMAAGGGLVFGVAEGTLLSTLGGTLGALVAFGLSRTVAADAVAGLGGERVAALRDAVEREGFVAVLYARIFPGVPRDLSNYAFGLTRVGVLAFGSATLIGTAPRAYAYTALGGSLGSFDSTQSIVAIGVLVAMGLAGLGLAAARRRRGRPT